MNSQITEKLLEVWLAMSMSISNRRIVEGLSYNEAKVCNILYRRLERDCEACVTATDLCRETRMLKSAMNATLNRLEKKNMIQKVRSEEDKRQLSIVLNKENLDLYRNEHQRILDLLGQVIERVGADKIETLIPILEEVTESANEVFCSQTGGKEDS